MTENIDTSFKLLRSYYAIPPFKLSDGDNRFIKDYSSEGIIARDLWQMFHPSTCLEFWESFIEWYGLERLLKNTSRCYFDINAFRPTNQMISRQAIFDLLVKRIIPDTFIGFHFEDYLRNHMKASGQILQNPERIRPDLMEKLDIKYNIDIITFHQGEPAHLLQVKNPSSFVATINYMNQERLRFAQKETEVQKLLNVNLPVEYIIYDKNAYINSEGNIHSFYINPNTNNITFTLPELTNQDGSLKIKLKKCKTKTL